MNRVSSQMAAGVLFLLTTVSALGAPPSTRQLCGLHAVLHILDHYKIEYQAVQVEHAIFGRDEKVFSSLHDLRVALEKYGVYAVCIKNPTAGLLEKYPAQILHLPSSGDSPGHFAACLRQGNGVDVLYLSEKERVHLAAGVSQALRSDTVLLASSVPFTESWIDGRWERRVAVALVICCVVAVGFHLPVIGRLIDVKASFDAVFGRCVGSLVQLLKKHREAR